MRSHDKTRDHASTALLALRTGMGMSQQAFAVEVLKTAVTTIARYETSHPPRGDVLLRLAEIADQHKRPELRDVFRSVFVEDLLKKIGFSFCMLPAVEGRPEHGYYLTRVDGANALRATVAFVDIVRMVQAKDPKLRKKALGGILALARRLNGNPEIDDMKDQIVAATSGTRERDQ